MVKKAVLLLIMFILIANCNTMYSQTESIASKDDSILFCNRCDSLYNRICPSTPEIFGGHPDVYPQFHGEERVMMKFIAENLTQLAQLHYVFTSYSA
jgi:hypothetical protein